MRRGGFAIVLAVLVALAAVGVASAKPKGETDTSALRDGVTTEGILEHETAFQGFADSNDNNRASGSTGYDASAAYVTNRLLDAGYRVIVQPFDFLYFEELAPTTFARTDEPNAYVEGEDFLIMEYSGSGTITDEPVVPTNDVLIPPGAEASSSNSGCEPEDFTPASTEPGEDEVALIQRGTCDFIVKARNAQEAGYDAVIIFNEGQEGRTEVLSGTLGDGVTIPVIGASFAVGQELYEAYQAREENEDVPRVSIFTSTLVEERRTSNVLADTPGGNLSKTVVVGAHLDSVSAGPGINDNGSGSSAILEIAEQMSELGIEPRNKVRFAFWGAEEAGLVGSQFYVDNLSKRQQGQIAVNLNFDMLGSPNYVRFVYDGDGSDTPTAGPKGSDAVERVFNNYFASQGLETEPTAFDGRSDYGPFIDVGIPAGGLFSGAEDLKTAEEAEIYGGEAGAPHDPCYHESCDSFNPVYEDPDDAALYAALAQDYPGEIVGNLNTRALDELSDGAAHATLVFAQAKGPVRKQGSTQGVQTAMKGPDPTE